MLKLLDHCFGANNDVARLDQCIESLNYQKQFKFKQQKKTFAKECNLSQLKKDDKNTKKVVFYCCGTAILNQTVNTRA